MEKLTQNDNSSLVSYPEQHIISMSNTRPMKMPVRGLYNTIKSRGTDTSKASTPETFTCTASSDNSLEKSENDVLTAEVWSDDSEYPSVPYHHTTTKLKEESKRSATTMDPLRGMSWLLESGRKKQNQVQSQESHGMLNAQCRSTSNSTRITVETPAKANHPHSYVTPQNKNKQFEFHKEVHAGVLETIKDSPTIFDQDKENVEFPRTCNKPDSLYINDSGVVVSSFYSNTKTMRSIAITSEYPNYSCHTPLITQDKYQTNTTTSSHSIMGGRHVKRIALHENFGNSQASVITRGESKSSMQVPNTPLPKPPQHHHTNADKENNIHLVPLDLSDKADYHCSENKELTDNIQPLDLSDRLKEFKSVDKRKESDPKVLESKQVTNMACPLNLKLPKSSEYGINIHRNEAEPGMKPAIGNYSVYANQPPRPVAPLELPVQSVAAPTQVALNNYASSMEVLGVDAMEVKPAFHTSVPASKQGAGQFKPIVHSQPKEMKQSFQPPKPRSEQVGPGFRRQSNEVTLDMYSILNSPKPSAATLVVKNKLYTIMGQLGRGGSSVVYQVLDHETNAQVAIKCVNLAGVDVVSAQGYLNEIKLLEKLQHCDCVIRLCDYEYLKHSQMLYVVMEKGDIDFSKLLKGISKEKKISSLMIAYYWTEMVNAVKCIHEIGIIHSDLKPANFLLVSGRLKLIDFGIASSLNVDSTSVVKENILGTFNYISPEAIEGTTQMPETRKISFKSDIWSLGCILYNLVYGRTPFAHIVHNMSKLCAITNRNHKIEYSETADCPKIFLLIMKSCLQYRPIDRPSAEALLRVPFLPTLQDPSAV